MRPRSALVSFLVLTLALGCGLATAQDAPKKKAKPVRALPKPGVTVDYVERIRHELIGSSGEEKQLTVALIDVSYSLSVVKSKSGGQRIMTMSFGPGSVLVAWPLGTMSLDVIGDVRKLDREQAVMISLTAQHLLLENRTFEFRRDARNRILDLRELPRPEDAPAPRDLGVEDEAAIATVAKQVISERLLALETRAIREGKPSKKELCIGGAVSYEPESSVERHDSRHLVTRLVGSATKARFLEGKKDDETGETLDMIRASRDFSARCEGQTTISRIDGLIVSSRRALTTIIDQGEGEIIEQTLTTTTTRGKRTVIFEGVPDEALPRTVMGGIELEEDGSPFTSVRRSLVIDLVPSDDRARARRGEGSRILVKGRSVSLADLRAILKASGFANPARRLEDDPRLSSTDILLRCHGRHAIGLAKIVMEMCADPEIRIIKINFALAGRKYLPLYLSTDVMQGVEQPFDENPVVIAIGRATGKDPEASRGQLRYSVDGKAVPGAGAAARAELRKRFEAAFPSGTRRPADSDIFEEEEGEGERFPQFDIEDEVSIQEWIDTFSLILASRPDSYRVWFRAFGMKRMLFMRSKPVSDLQLEVWTRALKLDR
jgi:hypothetical protein